MPPGILPFLLIAMDLVVKQNCPSCGAAIELREADRLIRCSYCDISNFMVTRGPFRFVLPDQIPSDVSFKDRYYFPYLRFKGELFSCHLDELNYKIVDTTYLGLKEYELPSSLGLRPQAMRLLPVTSNLPGRFVRTNEKISMIFDKAAQLSEIGRREKQDVLVHRSFIGETVSIIYLPSYFRNGQFFDGVLNQPLQSGVKLRAVHENSIEFQEKWVPSFISTICPRCGDDLVGQKDSVVLGCSNCHGAFQEQNGRLVEISWQIIPSEQKRIRYLPFWRLDVEAEGVNLTHFGDLLRLTNQPVVVREIHRKLAPTFVVPAFKIRPKTFLRLGGAMTLGQADFSDGKTAMQKGMYPVTLPPSEAEQALKVIMAAMTVNKGDLLPFLSKISFVVRKMDLLYLPFVDQGHDLVQEQTGVSVISNVLKFGRQL